MPLLLLFFPEEEKNEEQVSVVQASSTYVWRDGREGKGKRRAVVL